MPRLFALFLFLVLPCAASDAGAIVVRHDVDDARYRVDADELPALVDLPGEGHGVLIAPGWVLTAAHTVAGHVPACVTIGTACREVKRVVLHAGYRPLPDDVVQRVLAKRDATEILPLLAASADIALVELVDPVADIAPVPLFRGRDELGRLAKLVGKGGTGTGLEGQPPHSPHRTELRRAFNTLDFADERWLGYRFDEGGLDHDLEGVGGNGDSGSPMLVEVDGRWHVAGLMAWKLAGDDPMTHRAGKYGSQFRSTRVSSYLDWIDATLAGR
jgi:hypothetical protein